MKKKKNLKMIYTAVFFAMCAIPAVLYPVAANNTETDGKPLAEMPMLVKDGSLNSDFSQDCEAWLTDHLPFRSFAVTVADIVKSGIFRSDASGVITGKKGWIFDIDTADDYCNYNAMTDEELKAAAVSLSLVEENVSANGGNFVFVSVPDKSSVYGEFMPSRYKKSDENNLTRLQKMLSEYEVNFADMLWLMNAKKSFGVYHARDTHWNNYGALLGYDEIMNALGKDHKPYSDTDYIPEKNWKGDLDKKLYPLGIFRDYQYNLNIQCEPFEFTEPSGVYDTQAQLEVFMSDKAENDHRISTGKTESLGNGSLYMIRDSFGNALLPFFIDNYDTTLFEQTDCPDMSAVEKGTDMVYEVAEKNLCSLFRTAPVMKAPVRENISEGAQAPETIDFDWFIDESGTRIYGELKENMLSDDGRVYVKLTGDDCEAVYEAFPVYEEELLGGEGKYGFSFMPDTSVLTAGKYDLTVISGGKSYIALSVSPLEFTEDRIETPEKPETKEEKSEKTKEDEQPVPEAEWVDGDLADRAVVLYNDVPVAVGDDINELLESLGDEASDSESAADEETEDTEDASEDEYDDSEEESEDESDDEVKTEYYYAGMTILTDEDGIIYSIEINESLYPGRDAKTAGGLQCGSTVADIIAAFGDTEDTEASSIVYEEDGLKVQVLVRKGKVSSVVISAAEEE